GAVPGGLEQAGGAREGRRLTYLSPLGQRYASPAMQALWGERRRVGLWRRLWLALMEAQQELGLDIPDRALAELRAHLDDADPERAAEHEKRLRHDVMAHIHHLGEQAPAARPFLHLGATSAYVTDNADLILMREGMQLLLGRVAAVVVALSKLARRYRDVPCLAYTHFQPAQLTTVGKRVTLWMQELLLDAEELLHRLQTLRSRAVNGTNRRQTSLARFVIELEGNAWHTAAAQWLERTLDDSANRRLVIPEAFLASDAILVLATNVAAGLEVREAVIARHVAAQMPFLATERLLMRGVKAGGDRQRLHEVIRTHSLAVAQAVAEQGVENDLLERLARDPAFQALKLAVRPDELDPTAYVGRAQGQVDEYLQQVVAPALRRIEAVAPPGAAAIAEVTVWRSRSSPVS